MRAFENLLAPGSTELPECCCGAEMRLAATRPLDDDTEIRVFRCDPAGTSSGWWCGKRPRRERRTVNELSRMCRYSVVAVRFHCRAGRRHTPAPQADGSPALVPGGATFWHHSLPRERKPKARAGRFRPMHTVLLILALWCVPSILLVAVRVWHVYKAISASTNCIWMRCLPRRGIRADNTPYFSCPALRCREPEAAVYCRGKGWSSPIRSSRPLC